MPSIDGTGVPVTAKETAGRDGKGEDGRARTREVKLGRVLHPGQARREGIPGPGPGFLQLHRHLRARHVFAGLVKAEGIRRGAGHVRQFTILGDGAAWIWNIASRQVPRGHPDR